MNLDDELSQMESVFEICYDRKKWIKDYENAPSVSGPGSFPEHAEYWLSRLKNFLQENKIRSVVDYGCGDFAIYKNFDWQDIDYLGIDISPTAIDLAKKNAPDKSNIKFILDKTIDLPKADLLIVKDVLGHWSGLRSTRLLGDKRYLITEFLSLNLKKFKSIIIVDGAKSVIDDFFPDTFKPIIEIIPFGGSKGKKTLYTFKL
jgi:SAM-dependent methyltransferase